MMKLLLVLASPSAYRQIADYVKVLGAELILYQHPVKAMDNISEINPDCIIVSASDFPRHWKTLAAFAGSDESAEKCSIVLLHGGSFSETEIRKARHLGIEAILDETRLDERSLQKLRQALRPHLSAEKWIEPLVDAPPSRKKLSLIITHPLSGALIPGRIAKISTGGALFKPDEPRLVKQIAAGTELNGCSLRAGASILSPLCRVVRKDENITLEFKLTETREKRILERFVAGIG